MESDYVGEYGDVDVSGISDYVNLISDRIDVYGQTGLNPGQVQLSVDEHRGRTEEDVHEYFRLLEDEGLLELQFDGMDKMPSMYSVTDKGRYVFNPDKEKQLGEDYWVAQKDNLLVVLGEEYTVQTDCANELVAETNFQELNEENVESLLEP